MKQKLSVFGCLCSFWYLHLKVCSACACACGCISSQFCQCNSPELKFLCENNESSRRVHRRSKVHWRSKDDSALQKSVLLHELSSSLQKLTTASNALQCLKEKKSVFQSKSAGSPSLVHLVQWFCFCKRSNIPHICHESHENSHVNFFGRCKFLQI